MSMWVDRAYYDQVADLNRREELPAECHNARATLRSGEVLLHGW